MECFNFKLQMLNSFCTICGTKVPSSTFELIVTEYFRKGFTYVEILDFLKKYHSLEMSLRTPKKKLKSFNLHKKCHSREEMCHAVNALQDELTRNNSVGYRTLWHHLRHDKCINVPRDLIMLTLRDFDLEGVSLRRRNKLKRRNYRSQGPNFMWHADGYDKLKQYGFMSMAASMATVVRLYGFEY